MRYIIQVFAHRAAAGSPAKSSRRSPMIAINDEQLDERKSFKEISSKHEVDLQHVDIKPRRQNTLARMLYIQLAPGRNLF